MNNEFFENLWESIEMLNLSYQKKEKLLADRNKLSYYKVFNRKSISNRNSKNADVYE